MPPLTPHELDRARALLLGAAAPALDELRRGPWQETLRRAFRARALQAHPDRARLLGRPEALLAAEFRALERAYDLLARHLAAPPAPAAAPGPVTTAREAPVPPPAAAAAAAAPPRSAPAPAPGAPAPRPELFYRGELPRQAMRFAEFLDHSGVVSWQRLIAAVAWQREQRPLVGDLAVAHGLMTRAEVEALLGRRARERESAPFAEYAVRTGRLAEAQRAFLLARQRAAQPRIGDYFVEQGLLTRAQLDQLLARAQAVNAAFAGPPAGR